MLVHVGDDVRRHVALAKVKGVKVIVILTYRVHLAKREHYEHASEED